MPSEVLQPKTINKNRGLPVVFKYPKLGKIGIVVVTFFHIKHLNVLPFKMFEHLTIRQITDGLKRENVDVNILPNRGQYLTESLASAAKAE